MAAIFRDFLAFHVVNWSKNGLSLRKIAEQFDRRRGDFLAHFEQRLLSPVLARTLRTHPVGRQRVWSYSSGQRRCRTAGFRQWSPGCCRCPGSKGSTMSSKPHSAELRRETGGEPRCSVLAQLPGIPRVDRAAQAEVRISSSMSTSARILPDFVWQFLLVLRRRCVRRRSSRRCSPASMLPALRCLAMAIWLELIALAFAASSGSPKGWFLST